MSKPTVRSLFATPVYEASLAQDKGFAELLTHIEEACEMLAEEDEAGRAWCRREGYGGYTSYASLDDLPQRVSVFDELKRKLDRHAAAFADTLAFDLGRGRLKSLKLEDPRLPLQMAAPPRRKDAPETQQAFVTLSPAPGTVYLWESWLRHEVPPNRGKTRRISISFNYAWK
jgi:hypothetical protein